MCCLRYFCLLRDSCVQHTVLWFLLCLSFVLCLVLPVSLDCPFLIFSSVFSDVYLVLANDKLYEITMIHGKNIHWSNVLFFV